MLGPQHIRAGVVGGLAVVALSATGFGLVPVEDVLLFPAVAGGAALLNDWDTKSSTVTKSFRPISTWIHWLIVWAHRFTYATTRRGLDPTTRHGPSRAVLRVGSTPILSHRRWRSAHRGITHSMLIAAAFVPIIGYTCVNGPWWISVCIVLGCVMLAGRLVLSSPLLIGYAVIGLVHYGVEELLLHVAAMGWLWGLAIGIGTATHNIGDCATTHGVPLLAPFTWKNYRSPIPFDAGSWFELHVVKWVLIAVMVYLLYVVAGQLLARY